MADALSVIPAFVLRNLSDKLYEKRKNAALEVYFPTHFFVFFFFFISRVLIVCNLQRVCIVLLG